MAEDWYIENADGSIRGPLSEREVATELLSGVILDSQRVRQGKSGQWCEAPRARTAFRRLAETGWYIQEAEQVFQLKL